jgi:hypothetical protein
MRSPKRKSAGITQEAWMACLKATAIENGISEDEAAQLVCDENCGWPEYYDSDYTPAGAYSEESANWN